MVPLAATPIADGATGTTDVAAATERVGIVFGIGLNLTVPEDHLPTDKATSLQLVAHGLPDSMTLRDMIAAHLVDGLRSRLADFEADPHREATRAMEEMRPVCWTLDKPCEAHFVDGTTLRLSLIHIWWSWASTWLKPSSTGVSRPKMDTSTVSFCVDGSTSETTAAMVVNGPSVTVT